MQIFVRAHRTQVVDVPDGASLKDILPQSGIYVEDCYFTFGSKLVQSDVPLTELGIEDGDTLDAQLRLLGGGKKRKKKTYTKPKKPQHKRQHEKLRALKMYKVEGQKVIRCKKECPTCGPGIFMATHFDRICCGKCTTTYLYEKADKE